jgi:SAM-dependent methyltransferase
MPQLSKTGKALLTVNQFGFYVTETETNWILEGFDKLCQEKPTGLFLDIGTAWGSTSKRVAERGARVIANDLALAHLLYCVDKLSNDEKQRVWLNLEPFPDLDIPAGSLDGILIHRILHFLNGEDIERGLANAFKWLKPGGKIFIVVMCPDHVALRDKYKPTFLAKKTQGDPWPGMWMDVATYLPEQAYALPKYLHVMDEEILYRALKTAGFAVEKSGYVAFTKIGVETNRDGRETVGIIGIKPH